jgi:heat shock protein HslJ
MTRIVFLIAALALSNAGWTKSLDGLQFVTASVPAAPEGDYVASLAFGAGSVSGSGGCNRFNGSYQQWGVRRIRFGSLSSTRKFCGPASAFETRYFNALSRARLFRMSGQSLRLYSGGKQPRLLLVLLRTD